MDFKPLLKKAQAHLGKEEYREAAAIYQDILKKDQNHAIALQAMGQIAFKVSNLVAAEDYFQKSLTSNPGQYRVWIHLGEVCLKARKPEKGLQAYRNAIKIDPKRSEGHLRLGNALLVLNKREEAYSHLEKAFMVDHDSPSAFRLLTNAKTISIDDPVAREAIKRLKSGAGDELTKAHLHYGLAYIYEKSGGDKKFFEHLRKANQNQKKIAPPWTNLFEFNAKDIQNNFTNETLSRGIGEETRQFTPVFVIGMPRSGTTLTEQVISAHPDVFGADETDFLTKYVVNKIAVWTKKPLLGGINDINQEQLRELSQTYQNHMRRVCPDYDFITDKFLANYLTIGLIKMIMPWARVVNLYRHPMDIAFSIYRNFFLPTLPFCFDLKDIGRYYSIYMRVMKFWDNLLPGFVHHVYYEDLVENFDQSARKIIDFCGLPWDEACLEPHKNKRAVMTLSQDQVRKPIYKSSIGKWKKFEKELQPFKDACLEFGINVDDYGKK